MPLTVLNESACGCTTILVPLNASLLPVMGQLPSRTSIRRAEFMHCSTGERSKFGIWILNGTQWLGANVWGAMDDAVSEHESDLPDPWRLLPSSVIQELVDVVTVGPCRYCSSRM